MNSIVLWIGAVVALFSCIMVVVTGTNDTTGNGDRENETASSDLMASVYCAVVGFAIMGCSILSNL